MLYKELVPIGGLQQNASRAKNCEIPVMKGPSDLEARDKFTSYRSRGGNRKTTSTQWVTPALADKPETVRSAGQIYNRTIQMLVRYQTCSRTKFCTHTLETNGPMLWQRLGDNGLTLPSGCFNSCIRLRIQRAADGHAPSYGGTTI